LVVVAGHKAGPLPIRQGWQGRRDEQCNSEFSAL
jgi:hypothetical protein